jgi:hypothetical protein
MAVSEAAIVSLVSARAQSATSRYRVSGN